MPKKYTFTSLLSVCTHLKEQIHPKIENVVIIYTLTGYSDGNSGRVWSSTKPFWSLYLKIAYYFKSPKINFSKICFRGALWNSYVVVEAGC